jgi:hypothetical protein
MNIRLVEKMDYKILIGFKSKPKKPLSMNPFKIQLKLTNIGDSVFPGGELTYFSVTLGGTTQSVTKSNLPKIPPIKPTESIALEPHQFVTFGFGAAWVEVHLVASDGRKANLFQNPENDMGSVWKMVFPIRSSEHATMIELLKEIVKLLKARGEQ